MKASDIRIGNLVYRNGLTVKCDHMSIDDCYKFPYQYNPIPITKEWLVKLGFKNVNNLYFYHSDFGCKIEKLFNHWSIRFIIAPNQSLFIRHIEYIHEVQNMYYFFKKEEL